MYIIDLLGGEGVPIRSRPGCIAFACLLIVVPLIVGIVIVGIHLDRQVTVSIQSQELSRLEGVLGTLSAAMEAKRSLEEKQANAVSVLNDIKTVLRRHTQWSPVLAAVTESLPEALILTKFEARQAAAGGRREAGGKDLQPTAYSLQIGVSGYDGDASYHAVQQLQDRLRSSVVLGPRLEAVALTQESATLGGEDVVRYELNCTFKPEFVTGRSTSDALRTTSDERRME